MCAKLCHVGVNESQNFEIYFGLLHSLPGESFSNYNTQNWNFIFPLHYYSLIKGIFQGGGLPQHQESNAFQGPSPGDSRGSGIPTSLAAKRSGSAPRDSWAPPSLPPSLYRADWTPTHRNLLPLKLYWYSEGKGSAKNSFPRQSEQIILMRAWKWETNDTKLAWLLFVNYGEGTKPLPESAVGEQPAALRLVEGSFSYPNTSSPQSCSFPLISVVCSSCFGCQGPLLLIHVCLNFPLGRSTDLWRKSGYQSPLMIRGKASDRSKHWYFPDSLLVPGDTSVSSIWTPAGFFSSLSGTSLFLPCCPGLSLAARGYCQWEVMAGLGQTVAPQFTKWNNTNQNAPCAAGWEKLSSSETGPQVREVSRKDYNRLLH